MAPRNRIGSALQALVVGLVLTVPGCKEGTKEVGLKFADCPASVQKTIIDHAGGVQFPDVNRETMKDGRVVYEAKGRKANGQEIEIKVAADGRLIGFKDEEGD